MIRIIFIAVMAFVSIGLYANEVSILNVEFTQRGDTWSVSTTLRHDDTGWDHYADAWRVVDEKGNELGKRVLFHPHENEQPFTRSLQNLVVPAGVSIVYVEAHDKVHGWSKDKVRVDLSRPKGDRFKVRR